MSWVKFAHRTRLDWAFEIGVVLKGLDAIIEVVGGGLLLMFSADTIYKVVVALTRSELAEDPHDFIATHLLSAAAALTGSTVLFGAIYLLFHGVVKIALVIALLRDKTWAYPWMIVFLGLFIAYQLYRMTFAASWVLAGLTLFDGLIVVLTWVEYRKLKRRASAGCCSSGVGDESASSLYQAST